MDALLALAAPLKWPVIVYHQRMPTNTMAIAVAAVAFAGLGLAVAAQPKPAGSKPAANAVVVYKSPT